MAGACSPRGRSSSKRRLWHAASRTSGGLMAACPTSCQSSNAPCVQLCPVGASSACRQRTGLVPWDRKIGRPNRASSVDAEGSQIRLGAPIAGSSTASRRRKAVRSIALSSFTFVVGVGSRPVAVLQRKTVLFSHFGASNGYCHLSSGSTSPGTH